MTANGKEAILYQIVNWKAQFEVSQSGRYDSIKWIALRISHDDRLFRRLMRLPDGLEVYGAMMVLAQIAGRNPKARRGLLESDGKPLTIEDISIMTGAAEAKIEHAIKALTEFGWLEVVQSSPSDTESTPCDTETTPTRSVQVRLGEVREGEGRKKRTDQGRGGVEGKPESALLAAPSNAPPPEPVTIDDQAASILRAYPTKPSDRFKTLDRIREAIDLIGFLNLLADTKEFAIRMQSASAGSIIDPEIWFSRKIAGRERNGEAVAT